VDVIVGVVRGPLVHFERIEVRGNSKTRDKVIRREMEVAEGDLFSETKLEASRKRITALGFSNAWTSRPKRVPRPTR